MGLVEYNHDFYGKKWENMTDAEQEAVKQYEEANYGGNLELPETSDSGLENTVNE